MPHSRRLWIALLIVVLIALALWWFPNWQSDDQSSDAPASAGRDRSAAVAAIEAQRGDLEITVGALGTVRSLSSIDVYPRVEGELLTVDFEEGEHVEKGQRLATIDPRDYQAQLAAAQGQLVQDQAQLKSAREDLERYETLAQSQSISRQELEQQRQLVRQYQGAVASDRADIDSAQVQLDYTDITAPNAGIIGIRNVDPGNLVSSGDDDPIATLTQLDPISVVFSLPSQYVPTLREQLASGDAPSVSVTTVGDERLEGQLTSIDSQIDTATGTVRLRARFDNAADRLYPSAFVDVRLTVNTLRDRVIVPAPAVQTGQDGLFVYVVGDDDTVTRHDVVVSASENHRSALASGVSAGERVVVDGVDSLRDGAKVRVVSNALPGETRASSTADDDADTQTSRDAS
ncbi:efflux RND transporter periplasmic adaptor subunit [Chromohalobacter sp. TMW 2.2308]|uniref:Efflux RND transporter periplasmic adaptor subunit n=1 Tax=Chromohalobacter moromii TaxID=2860329 RepID=A0A9X2WZ79_9GAMM|nr:MULTISPECIES: efflux RND transporter periplasmic adaptor subunit [Chromohalobacter]MCK2042003.1 efflux RND transporter periplasmic adaptor subunit [Chromohalobacter moromii]MCK2044924.1 efflux RND transporter periplasmic adaptor subunit [Chromohalobacter moromii]MCT8503927.1 efflux RND transporter periplasmic adaptor subunit [Chromohalobacter moromii]MCT8514151.1 efflux RND transporter periplasmic adaptor subunit [Chromohalobacter sp. TMW 2.2271]